MPGSASDAAPAVVAALAVGGAILAFGRIYFGSLFVKREELAETVDRLISASEAKHKAALDRQTEVDRRIDDAIDGLREGHKQILGELAAIRTHQKNGHAGGH